MPRTQAGKRYPHITTAAKPHDHSMCGVVEVIAERVAGRLEPWGTLHYMPPLPSETAAKKVKGSFYSARYCRKLTGKLGEPVSIQSDWEQQPTGYVVWVRVWPRSVAKAEITRRVQAGEELHYNVLRGA